jgi:hypothetical protein
MTMILKRLTTLTAALAVAATLGFCGSARADYSYSTSVSLNGGAFAAAPTFSAGTTSSFTFTGLAATISLPPTGTSTPTDVSLTASVNTAVALAGSVSYTYDLKITNTAGSATTGDFFISGTLTYSNVSGPPGGGSFTNNYTSVSLTNTPSGALSQSLVIGGVNFTVSEIAGSGFTSPVPNQQTGAFNTIISTVPEPTSIVMLGLGLGGLGLVRFRNRRARA